MTRDINFPTIWYVRPAKAQTSLFRPPVWAEPLLVGVNLLAEHHLEFLSLKGGYTGLSESTLVGNLVSRLNYFLKKKNKITRGR